MDVKEGKSRRMTSESNSRADEKVSFVAVQNTSHCPGQGGLDNDENAISSYVCLGAGDCPCLVRMECFESWGPADHAHGAAAVGSCGDRREGNRHLYRRSQARRRRRKAHALWR